MLISTKYGLGDSIWFIFQSDIYLSQILRVEVCSSYLDNNNTEDPDSVMTDVAYRVEIQGANSSITHGILVFEKNAFSSKDELINTITERFHKSIAPGAG